MKKYADEELLIFLANAQQTYALCGGHHKASRNHYLVTQYKTELTKRGVPIPANEELYKTGIFNGQGSY